MTNLPSETLFERLVDLTRAFLALYRSMDMHVHAEVLPHLGEPARSIARNLIEHIRTEKVLHPDLLTHLDTTIIETRKAIAVGTVVKQVPIPRARLIGCSEAFDTHISYSPAAQALQAALPPLERLQQVAREAHGLGEAIQLGLDLVPMK